MGFKTSRLDDWKSTMDREGRSLSLLGIASLWFKVLLSATRTGGVTRKEWRRRMRICRACPLFDPSLRRCRPFDGSKLGCGCFVPFMALTKTPYRSETRSGCWGRVFLNQHDVGWS